MKKAVTLEVDNLEIVGELYLPTGQVSCPTVCVCHGIPDRSLNPNDGGYPLLAEKICRDGFAVLIFNFRGTGDSGGNLDILGWTRDLKAVIDYLLTLPEIDKSCLSLLGFSGGAAVSIYLASQDSRISSVIACACPAEFTFFTEAYDLQSIVNHFRSLGAIRDDNFPPSAREWLDGFNLISPIKYVADLAPRPLLLVHSSRDETVAVSHAHELYDKAREPKELSIIDSADHGLRQNDEAMAVIIPWLKFRTQII